MSHSTNDHVAMALLKLGRIKVDFETGEVFNLTGRRPNSPVGNVCKKGYLRTNFHFSGAQKSVFNHRIVWIAAHGIPEDRHFEIDHINGCKTDNRLVNLEVVSAKENVIRSVKNGLHKGGRSSYPRDSRGCFLPKPSSPTNTVPLDE